jgi:hypothetical protein
VEKQTGLCLSARIGYELQEAEESGTANLQKIRSERQPLHPH